MLTLPKFAKNICPISIGILAFLVVIGPQALNPCNFQWIHGVDVLGAWLAWHFFRNSSWNFPLGANPDYGLDIANSIVYSDSNNLFAFIFKLFSNYLPANFQYFGFWIAICFVLQAYFAWKLIHLFTNNKAALITGTLLFTFAPPMLWRLWGHYSLVSHFLILAGLYLYFVRQYNIKASLAWIGLLLLSLLIHFYIFVMIFGLFMAYTADGFLNKYITLKYSIANIFCALVICFAFMYVIGYFIGGHSFPAGGFGKYKMNLLSLIDADNWSYVLPDIPNNEGQYEGFNFLGLGGIVLTMTALWKALQAKLNFHNLLKKHIALFTILSLFTLFALSNEIALGPIQILIFPYRLYIFPEVLRSSGRFFWPCYYLIFLFSIIIIARYYSWHKCTVFLIFCTVLQLADTSHEWVLFGKGEPNNFTRDDLINSHFWRQAAKYYKRIRGIPIFEMSQTWPIFATYAARNGMATDIIYLTRYSTANLDKINAKNDAMLASGKFAPDTLYILNKETYEKAKKVINPKNDLLMFIDGIHVLAPGFLAMQPASVVPPASFENDPG